MLDLKSIWISLSVDDGFADYGSWIGLWVEIARNTEAKEGGWGFIDRTWKAIQRLLNYTFGLRQACPSQYLIIILITRFSLLHLHCLALVHASHFIRHFLQRRSPKVSLVLAPFSSISPFVQY